VLVERRGRAVFQSRKKTKRVNPRLRHILLSGVLLALSISGKADTERLVGPVDRAVVAPMVPMIVAASSGDVATIQKLLATGTALEERDIVGTTPLIFAARYGRLPLVEFLLQRGAAVNAQTASGASALSEAVRRGSLPVVEALLGAGADANLRDHHGRSALYIAVGYQELAIVERLLAHHADIAAADESGATPLERAADLGLTAIVTALLAAHPDLHNARIDAALCLAEQHGYRDIAGLLKTRGATDGAGCAPVAAAPAS